MTPTGNTPVPPLAAKYTSTGVRLQLVTDNAHAKVQPRPDETLTDYEELAATANDEIFYGPGKHGLTSLKVPSNEELARMVKAAHLDRSELSVSESVHSSQPLVEQGLDLAVSRAAAGVPDLSVSIVAPTLGSPA